MANTLSNEETQALVERNTANGFEDLTEQKKAFAYAYVSNGYNHREAAQQVGVAKDSALKTLRLPLVSAMVAHLQQQTYLSDIITKDWVTNQCLNLLDIAMGNQEIPMVTGSGTMFDGKKFHPELATKMVDKLSQLTPEFKGDDGAKSGAVNIQMNFGAVMDNPEVVINGQVTDE